MYNRIANFVVDHAKWILLASLGIALLCATNLPKLKFDFTPQQLFRSTSDAADYREEFAERFGREDNLVFVVVEADDIYRREVVQFTRDLTLRLRGAPRVEAVDSLATMELPRAVDGGMLSTTPIVPTDGDVTVEQAEALRDLALSEPLVQGQVVGSSGKLTAVLIWISPELQDISELDLALDSFREAVDETGVPDGVKTSLGGIPFLRTRIVDELKAQQVTFIPGTALIYFLVLLLLFRRPVGMLAPLGVVGISVLLTVTMMVVTGSSINIINNILPTLIFIICISDSIHMLVRDAEESEAGLDRPQSVKAMIRHTGSACLLTSTTTSVGFFSLVAADTEILQNFGWQAGAGVMFGYVVTLLFLPAVAVLMRPVDRSVAGGSGGGQPRLERWLSVVGNHVLDWPKLSIVTGLLIAGVAAGFGSQVQINTVLLEVFEPGHPAYDSTMRLEEELAGILPVEIALDGPEPDTFKDPALFGKMRAVQQFAEKDPIVLSSQSLVDFHQAARAAVMGDPAQRSVLPDSREQVEQLHLLIAGSPDSRTGPNRFITSDFAHARILLRVSDAGAIEQLRLGTDLEEALRQQFEGTNIRYRITGDAYVASAALTSFIRDLFVSLLLAVVIIFAMMTIVFRSLTIGFISMLPNVIPLVLTLGYMGAAGIDLNTTTVIIFAISLGLAVDDTIHFLARFREELEVHPTDVRAAVLGAYNGAGRAILITSVMLLVGLVVLLFSSFVPAQYFARLTAITIAGALLGDLLILPPILYLVYRWKLERADKS